MRKALIASIIILLTDASPGQDHAPLQQQCEADAAVWAATVITGDGQGLNRLVESTSITYDNLQSRANEMSQCSVAFPRSSRYAEFISLDEDFTFAMWARMHHYLRRHGLMSEFLGEDTAGKR